MFTKLLRKHEPDELRLPPRSRSYRDAAGTLLLCGGRILEEVAGVADAAAPQEEVPPEAALRARVLLLAEGAPLPRGVLAERTLYASPDVLRKARPTQHVHVVVRSAVWHCCVHAHARSQLPWRCSFGARRMRAQIAGLESGDSLDAVAELYAPRLFTPTTEQARARLLIRSLAKCS
jgi:hypothetical protein